MIVDPNYRRIGWSQMTQVARPSGNGSVSTLQMTDDEREAARERERSRQPFGFRAPEPEPTVLGLA